jgi:RimJ/RimL family protein N-acetyltransferase
MISPTDRWPLFGLRVIAPLVELRYPDDALALEVAGAAAGGIHDPDVMPFAVPWTRDRTPDELALSTLQNLWLERATLAVDDWSVSFAVLVEGEVVGRQDLRAKRFGELGTVSSGSWIGQSHQGRGIGSAAREAMLAFAFEGLGARLARTCAFHDNARSIGVSRRLGYAETGRCTTDREGLATEQVNFTIDRAGWTSRPRPAVELVGLEPARAFLTGLE